MGRFVVLDEIGRGGMGRVYAAYDPELDRKVALKLVRPEVATDDLERASARLVREAQTMARISHPHVVPIYEVGAHDDQVFLAMELLDGPNLAGWLAAEPRSWRAILDVYLMAGRGLAAAHAAGLVHRDFKPSNVVLAGDLPKVSDFGLARPDGDHAAAVPGDSSPTPHTDDLTAPGTAVGTPRYMAPEQQHGAVDARADQYSFCRALDESWSATPPPRALRRVLARGLAVEPAARYPSMTALLDALVRARRRPRWPLVVVASAMIAVGVIAVATRATPAPPCSTSRARLAGAWDPVARARLASAFAALGPNGAATFTAIAGRLDAAGDRWVDMHRATCRATRVHHDQSPALMDLRMACLDARRAELAALVEELATPGATALPTMAAAVYKLRDPSACADVASLSAVGQPPTADAQREVAAVRAELAAARALGHVGRFPPALARVTAAVARARALAWRPLVAEALLEAGVLTGQAGHPDDGERLLLDAIWQAEASRQDRVAAEAWTVLVFAVVQQGTHLERAEGWAARATAAIERLGGDPDLRARLLNHLGAVAYRGGDYPEARSRWQRSLDASRAYLPAGHPDLARVENNLGIVASDLGDGAEAERHYRTAITIWEAAFGGAHPLVGNALTNLGSLQRDRGQLDDAIASYRRALAIYEASVGPDHPTVADTHHNLGNALLAHDLGAQAIASYRRALAIRTQAFGADSPQVAAVLSSLGSAAREAGDAAAGLVDLRRALAIQSAALGPEHPTTGITITAIGEAELTLGHAAAARPSFERALAIFTTAHGRAHVITAYALSGLGRTTLALGDAAAARPLLEAAVAIRVSGGEPMPLAESRLALAQALWSTGDRPRARTLAAEARAALGDRRLDPDLARITLGR